MNFSRATRWQNILLNLQPTDHSRERKSPSVLTAHSRNHHRPQLMSHNLYKGRNFSSQRLLWFVSELCPKARDKMVFIKLYQQENTHTCMLGCVQMAAPTIKLFSRVIRRNLHISLNVNTELCNYVKHWVCVIDCTHNCLYMGRGGMFSAAVKGEVPLLNTDPLAAVLDSCSNS